MHHDEIDGEKADPGAKASRRIIVVGPCAAGKSTLVEALQGLGYDAHVSAQEHSEITSLWKHSHPDILVALVADISAVRARRGGDWPEWLHDVQVQRLQAASTAADLTIDTTLLDPDSVSARVVAYLSSQVHG